MSGFLLDTNVVSELAARSPNPKVVAWLQGAEAGSLHISVLTLGEIAKGIASLHRKGASAKARVLQSWFDDLSARFRDATVPVCADTAVRWGTMAGIHPELPTIDGLFVATALVHGLTLVTRNVHDMAVTGVTLVNPWE